jgi:hypothetical protein
MAPASAPVPGAPPSPPQQTWPSAIRVRFLESWPEDEQPGDAFFLHCERERCTWSNCDGKHLIIILPNGRHWDVDSRAGNCSKREDRTHRCWVRRGDVRDGTLPVDKDGDTCGAGAGSILSHGYGSHPDYHGHLQHGELRAC